MITRWFKVIAKYLRQLLSILILGIVFFILDISGIVQVFLPDFKLTETAFIVILFVAFVIANVRIYDEHERRIHELTASRKDALKAVIQEVELNKASATHNASLKGSAKQPGALSFIWMSDKSCKDVFLSGRFVFKDSLLQSVREYLQTVSHINTLIASVEASTNRFQTADDTANAIRRYCGGHLNPDLDGSAQGMPILADRLLEYIARETTNGM